MTGGKEIPKTFSVVQAQVQYSLTKLYSAERGIGRKVLRTVTQSSIRDQAQIRHVRFWRMRKFTGMTGLADVMGSFALGKRCCVR